MPRVLVVEDNSDLAYGLQNNLEIEGYQVELAADGETGLEKAKGWEPDLIILDLMLPDLDGYRVLQHLRKEGVLTPVLILDRTGKNLRGAGGSWVDQDDNRDVGCKTTSFNSVSLAITVGVFLE